MAKPTSTAKDLLQILMLTLYLCALFGFAAGGYLLYADKQQVSDRDQANKKREKLEEILRDSDNKQTLIDYRFRKNKETGDKAISVAVQELLSTMGGAAPTIVDSQGGEEKNAKGGLEEHTYRVTFGLHDRDTLISFVERLEAEFPNIYVEELDLTPPRGKDADLSKATMELVLVTYVKPG